MTAQFTSIVPDEVIKRFGAEARHRGLGLAATPHERLMSVIRKVAEIAERETSPAATMTPAEAMDAILDLTETIPAIESGRH